MTDATLKRPSSKPSFFRSFFSYQDDDEDGNDGEEMKAVEEKEGEETDN